MREWWSWQGRLVEGGSKIVGHEHFENLAGVHCRCLASSIGGVNGPYYHVPVEIPGITTNHCPLYSYNLVKHRWSPIALHTSTIESVDLKHSVGTELREHSFKESVNIGMESTVENQPRQRLAGLNEFF